MENKSYEAVCQNLCNKNVRQTRSLVKKHFNVSNNSCIRLKFQQFNCILVVCTLNKRFWLIVFNLFHCTWVAQRSIILTTLFYNFGAWSSIVRWSTSGKPNTETTIEIHCITTITTITDSPTNERDDPRTSTTDSTTTEIELMMKGTR